MVMASGSSNTTTTCAAAWHASSICAVMMATYARKVSAAAGIAFIITFPSSTASVCERSTPTRVRTSESFLSDWNAPAKSLMKSAFAPWGPPASPMAPHGSSSWPLAISTAKDTRLAH